MGFAGRSFVERNIICRNVKSIRLKFNQCSRLSSSCSVDIDELCIVHREGNFSSRGWSSPPLPFFTRERARSLFLLFGRREKGKDSRVSLGTPRSSFDRNCEFPGISYVVTGSKSLDRGPLLQLGWVCQHDALPTIAQSIFFIGAIFGGLIFGWIADQYGRIPALIGSNVMGFLAGVATAFTNTFWQFALCRFFVGFAFDNCFTMMYILGNYRTISMRYQFFDSSSGESDSKVLQRTTEISRFERSNGNCYNASPSRSFRCA